MAIKNMAVSTLARLKQQAKIEKISFQTALQLFCQEDVIVPNPVKRRIVARLPDFEAPEIYTYSLESTVAEKLDAIIQRMETTSRIKDFYDIYYLSENFDFNGTILNQAVKATLEHRQRNSDADVFKIITGFVDNEFLNIQWRAFEPARNMKLEFKTVLNQMDIFLKPIYDAVLGQKEFTLRWDCKYKHWK